MNLYRVTRTDTDNVSWGEYLGFVVRAPNVERAKEIALTGEGLVPYLGLPSGFEPDGSNLKVTVLTDAGPEGIVLAAFADPSL
jgi:hypothetical protein